MFLHFMTSYYSIKSVLPFLPCHTILWYTKLLCFIIKNFILIANTDHPTTYIYIFISYIFIYLFIYHSWVRVPVIYVHLCWSSPSRTNKKTNTHLKHISSLFQQKRSWQQIPRPQKYCRHVPDSRSKIPTTRPLMYIYIHIYIYIYR